MFKHKANCKKEKVDIIRAQCRERHGKGLNSTEEDVCLKCWDKLAGRKGHAAWKGLPWRG